MEKRQMPLNGNRSSMITTPFDSQISSSPDSHGRRHLFEQQRLTQTQNPFLATHLDETLQSAFSRLNISPHYQPSFDGSINNDYGGAAGQTFLPLAFQEADQRNHRSLNLQQNGDVRNIGLLLDNGLNNNINNTALVRSHIDGPVVPGFNQDGFFPYGTPSLHRNRNGISRDPSNNLVLKNQNFLRSNLYNRKPPHWITQQQTLNFQSVEDLRTNIVALAKDQQGCRALQRRMNGMTREEIDMIFSEVIDCVGEMVLDPFGNYVVQRLVEICSEEQRTRILVMLTKTEFQLVGICLNMHGTRAVQKLLENLSTQQQISLVMAALSPGAVALTKDMNGHHVIQHCLRHFSEEDNRYLLNEVADNCFSIATDKSGCCVLQQCVDYSQGEIKQRLVAEIISNALLLAENPYGNYVVQHLLGLRVPEITASLVRQLEGSFTVLSCNKYGSNVVEKCFVETGEQHTMRIIMELLSGPNFSMLLLDPFGNYVIQSALTVSKRFVQGYVHNTLVHMVQKNAQMMRSNIYGKKVLAWFDRRKLQPQPKPRDINLQM